MAVFIGSIPNTQKDDVLLAKRILRGDVNLSNSIKDTHQLLQKSLQIKDKRNPFLFNRGRDTLYFFLKLLNLREDDEVVVQAFTCVAVIAPILWNDAKPTYVDINPHTFNMDLDLLEKNLSSKTRVVIIQHTFGNIADIQEVRKLIDKVNMMRKESEKIYLIEDCAHLFPSTAKKEEFNDVGKYSDMYFFSFSQDKSISCTQGAAMVINNEKLLSLAKKEYKKVDSMSKKEALYNARYIKLWNIIKNTYFTKIIPFTNITVGRILILLFRFLRLIKKQASADISQFQGIKKMSNVQAKLLNNQLEKIKAINSNRRKITEVYNTKLKEEFRYQSNNKALLRYPILISNREEIKSKLLKEEIIVGNWYKTPVYPLDKSLQEINYVKGTCPTAEKCARNVLNLPTNVEVSMNEVEKIVTVVNAFAKPVNI